MKNMTQGNVMKLLLSFAVPVLLGNIFQQFYTMADTMMVGQILGVRALAAMGATASLSGLVIGLVSGVSMGVSILIAQYYGARNIIWGMGTYFFSSFLQTFIRNDGAPKLAMNGVIAGGVTNIVLDYLFVYPMNMGMKGAALATVLGSSLTVVILCTHFFTKKNQLKFTLKGFHPSFLQKIIANGFTSFVIEAASGFTIFIFNLQLIRYLGNTGVSVYGIICNTALVVICLCKGIEQAAQPILSINHGAGLSSRILKVQSLSLKTSVIICTLPVLLGLFVPNLFTYIFLEPTSEILTLAAPAIRIYFTGFLFLGINMVFICYFQSVAKSVQSLSLCLLRGCILVVAFVYILPVFFGSTGIWLAFPAAEFLTMIVGICFYRQDLKAY